MKNLTLIISILFSFAIVFLLGKYFYHKDTIKEPKQLLRNLFISGILAGIIVIIISIIAFYFFPNLQHIDKSQNLLLIIFNCYIFIAFLEEITKFFMIYKISYHHQEFDQAYDIVLYSIFVGLGFALLENTLYTLSFNSLYSSILRIITALPAHICFQTIMGYYLYLNKFKKQNNNKNLKLSLIIPVFLHGSYDFLIFSSMNNINIFIIFITFLGSLYILTYIKIKQVISIDKKNILN